MNDDPSDAAAVAAVMRKDAKRATGKDPTFRIFRGWKFGLSYGPIPLPPREVVDALKRSVAERVGNPAIGAASYDQIAAATEAMTAAGAVDRQWILSACLHPRGRSSVDEDWHLLGQMTAAFGAPHASLRTPFETTNPNAVHYWIWDEESRS